MFVSLISYMSRISEYHTCPQIHLHGCVLVYLCVIAAAYLWYGCQAMQYTILKSDMRGRCIMDGTDTLLWKS